MTFLILLNCAKARLYADDTNFTITASCFSNLEKVADNKLRYIGQWLVAN